MADQGLKETLKERIVEYNALNKMYNDLCSALQIDDLLPSMISNDVIDFQEKGEIAAEKTERRRVQYFLDQYLLGELKAKDTSRFNRFLAVMKRSPKCNFLVKRLNHWMEKYKDCSATPDDDVPKGYITVR